MIEIARIIAILFIINHHILFHGGPLSGTKLLSFEYNLLLFFNTLFCSGVNIFGMISGFIGFKSHKFSNLIYYLLQTSLYNFSIAFIFKKIKPKTVKDLNYYLYPLFISDYWYFNAYFILYFFLPLINSGIKSLEKKDMGIFNLSLFLFFSCFNQIKHYSIRLRKDLFSFSNGFSYMWLLILYLFGSYLGKYNKYQIDYNTFRLTFICFSIPIAALIRNLIIIYKLNNYNTIKGMKVEYTSPSCVIISTCFIIILSRLNIKSIILKKLALFFSPLTFHGY